SKAHLAGQELNLQTYRHVAIAISRQCLSARSQFVSNRHLNRSLCDLDNPTDMDPSALAAHTADLQAGHSSSVAGTVYGRLATEQPGCVAALRKQTCVKI
ncbi:hypothetical protein MYU51_018522, partial [Penicillium brevicompactum]